MPRTKKLPSKLYRGFTSPVRSLPDFIVVGGKKCGTSSLYDYLVEHPAIAPAFRKEVHFFDKTGGAGKLRYRAYFPSVAYRRYVRQRRGVQMLTGEATPYYLFHPLAPERVRRMVPDVRLVALLRDPVDRAYSHYHHELRNGTEKLSFEEAIAVEARRLNGEQWMVGSGSYDSQSHRRYSYLARGIYVDQIQNWRRYFPKEQLLILKAEDLFEDPSSVLVQTLEFLGLPVLDLGEYGTVNKGGYEDDMDVSTREYLIGYFESHNERLYEYLGKDFGWASRRTR